MFLLSIAYFAPIRYYSILLRNDDVVIERHEHYNKQSYRNRCTIYSANGPLDLVIPVVRSREPKQSITDVEISYDTLWQKLHRKAIESAYRRSPFYEYYIDDLKIFFDIRHRSLYDFNLQAMRTICRLTKIPLRATESSEYMKPNRGVIDLRHRIHPKVDGQTVGPDFVLPRYTQVFADRWGFRPNLSILDLLFNVGPETKEYL